MDSEFKNLGFEKYLFVKSVRNIAKHFSLNDRCGIYILHHDNGQFYVGLAIDVVNRFTQHSLVKQDISHISFKEVPKDQLIETEKQTIYQLEALKKPLRNISIVSIITGNTKLDSIIDKEEQAKWLNNELGIESLTTPRFEYPVLREKYTQKFNQLTKFPSYEEIKEILNAYVILTIPFPRRTEYFFWSLTCLPNQKQYARLNIFWQETLVLTPFEYDNGTIGIDVLIALSKSKLSDKWTEENLKEKFHSIQFSDFTHFTGGQDQQFISIESQDFIEFLSSDGICEAIQEFNLRLMRKGGSVNKKTHCFDLADIALDTTFLMSNNS